MIKRDLIILGLGIVTTIFCVTSSILISSILPIGFAGLVLWVMLCSFANSVALFLLGMVIPFIYFSSSQPEIQGVLLLAVYGAMIIFTGIHWRFKERQSSRDGRLVLIVTCLGIYIWLSQNISRLNTDTWDVKYLLVSGTSLVPYGWLALTGPSLERIQGQKHLLAGLAMGVLGSAIMFLIDIQPFSDQRFGTEMWTVTAITIGSLKNSFGVLWVIGFALFLHWHPRSFQWLKFIGMALLLISIAFSFSRSSYMALCVVVAMHFWPRLHSRWLQILVGLGLAVFLIPNSVWERLGMTWTTTTGFDPSSLTRLVLWQAAIGAFFSSPLWGIGPNNFTEYLLRHGYFAQLSYEGGSITYAYAHNYFLSLFALTGIIGGILGPLVFWYSYRRCTELSKQGFALGDMVKLCLAAFFVASLFGEPLFDPVLVCIFLLILSTILSVDSVTI